MSNYKARVKAAVETYLDRQKKKASPTRRNQKPEKRVQSECLEWMREKMGWTVEIYEAKATFDPRAKIFRQQAMRAGVCDCQGITTAGETVAVEFKAPGRRPSFNSPRSQSQNEFVTQRIRMGAFGCVVDSAELLEKTYLQWKAIKNGNGMEAGIDYLLDQLPKKRAAEETDDELF